MTELYQDFLDSPKMEAQVSAAVYIITALEGIKSIQHRHKHDYELCDELESISVALENVRGFVEKQNATT